MRVVATAGHVDHGKSALVRALTGMEPDRWEEERRRGLTIDLGFAWFTLPSGERMAFVDVPGHERFVPNMLAGVGPVPAVLFVVAADEGWMPQSAEHLAAVDALGIRHGLLAVTRSDLASPAPALAAARRELAGTSLAGVPEVAVSAVTGQGLAALVAALDRLAAELPRADPAAPVRLWVDRVFTVHGSGTVVTGTLPAGTVRAGDELELAPAGPQPRARTVTVRALHSLGQPVAKASGVARVALNLRGVEAAALRRGVALLTPGEWALTSELDVRLQGPGFPPRPGAGAPAPAADGRAAGRRPPRELAVHIGAARVPARLRLLGGRIARLALAHPLPLHVGDRLLLRVPGAAPATRSPAAAAWPPVTGAVVLDVAPPPLRGRPAAAAAAAELGGWPDRPGAAELLARHRLLRLPALRAMGVAGHPPPVAGDWLADPRHWQELAGRLAGLVAGYAARDPLAAGLPVDAARAALGLPDRRLAEALAGVPAAAVTAAGGLLRPRLATGQVPGAGQAGASPAGVPRTLPGPVLAAVQAVRRELARAPFAAPEAGRLAGLGLGRRELAAATRAGLLLRVSDQVVLAPGADAQAAAVLARLPQPFTAAQARQALGTTRRVAIPLLEYLDRAGVTERLPGDRRRIRGGHAG
jgi:selenocysteine-specific elongation factor